ncbi:MAG: amidohydrolase family protein [Ilumatobacteraceae bacterium]
MPTILLKHAATIHTADTKAPQDVLIVDGLIAEVAADITPRATPDETVDLDGWLLLPSAVEPHAHLDKAFLAELIVNPTGDLMGAITAMQASRHLLSVETIIERAERAARLMAANGYRAVRTHADTTVEHGLRSIEALTEVRRRVADLIDVEIVALCGWPVVGVAGADQRALLHDAMAAGADLVGGCPHLEFDAGTAAATDVLLQVATDHGVGVDLHTDETLDASVLGLVELAERVLGGFEHRVTASHCVSLGMQSTSRQQQIAELVAEAGISVVALPHTNLFLQGRGAAPMPRGLTAVAALRAAGVNVAAGADNLQDPFNPVGRACPFETAGLMVMASHLLPHEAWESVSSASAAALDLEVGTIAPGAAADLLAVRATTVREAIAFGPDARRVWRRGVVIERSDA